MHSAMASSILLQESCRKVSAFRVPAFRSCFPAFRCRKDAANCSPVSMFLLSSFLTVANFSVSNADRSGSASTSATPLGPKRHLVAKYLHPSTTSVCTNVHSYTLSSPCMRITTIPTLFLRYRDLLQNRRRFVLPDANSRTWLHVFEESYSSSHSSIRHHAAGMKSMMHCLKKASTIVHPPEARKYMNTCIMCISTYSLPSKMTEGCSCMQENQSHL
jgi:hypothetical protein